VPHHQQTSFIRFSSSLEDWEEVWEEELFGEGGEECSLSTSPLGFKIMFLFVGQFEPM